MSVLIKGMEMPTNCWFCSVKSWDDDEYVCPFSGRTVKSGDADANRHEDCPLIELPYHGDLVDQKEIMREFAVRVRASNNSDFAKEPTWNDAVSLVESAPVVIPAERREE